MSVKVLWLILDRGSLLLGSAALACLAFWTLRLLPRWLSVGLLAAGLVSGLTLSTEKSSLPPVYPRPASPPVAAAPPRAADPAEQAVLEFHRELDGGNYSEAYAYLHPDWQYELSYRAFRDGYARTEAVGCQVEEVQVVAPDRRLVRSLLLAREAGCETQYQACYELVLTARGWRFAGCHLERSSPLVTFRGQFTKL